MFDGSDDKDIEEERDAVAFAVPTFQAPTGFFRSFRKDESLLFPLDTEVTRNLLQAVLHEDPSSEVRMASAYFNPTDSLMSVLRKFEVGPRSAHLVTAGPVSHGFAPKNGMDSRRNMTSSVPGAYLELARNAASAIASWGNVWMYNREGWIFHAKGLWITSGMLDQHRREFRSQGDAIDTTLIYDPSSITASIIGSGNFGARSENLDFESNCLLVLNTERDAENGKGDLGRDTKGLTKIQSLLAEDWNDIIQYTSQLDPNDEKELGIDSKGSFGSWWRKAALAVIRKAM